MGVGRCTSRLKEYEGSARWAFYEENATADRDTGAAGPCEAEVFRVRFNPEVNEAFSEVAMDRIVIDPNILAGKPVIRGTRLSVDFIVGLLGEGWTEEDIERNYPGVSHADVAACLQYAAGVLRSERVYPLDR